MSATPTSTEIGSNLARLRRRRGLTLDRLAELSSISRAAISALENGASNPRIETLWSLSNALGIEFGQLVGGRYDVEVTEAAGITARLIDRQAKPRPVEAFLMDLLANAKRYADAHAQGVMEHVVVLAGAIAAGPVSAPVLLRAGQSHQFAADVPHLYSAGSEASRAIVTVIYPEDDPSVTSDDQMLDWPGDKDGWENIRALLARSRVEIQNGCAHLRIIFKGAPDGRSAVRSIAAQIDIENRAANTARIFVSEGRAPAIATFYRSSQMRPLSQNAQLSSPLFDSCRSLSDAAITPWSGEDVDRDRLSTIAQNSDRIVEAALAAEVLTRLGQPTVPTGISQKRQSSKKESVSERLFEDRIDVGAYEAYELVHPAYARQVLAVAETLPTSFSRDGGTILDIGTGPGLPLQMLLELRPELRAVAVDPSDVAILHLRRRFAADNRVEIVPSSVIDYRPADVPFEAAISIGASHHLDTRVFFSRIHSCLVQGGTLIVADEMLTPFRNRRERMSALITHHLWYVLDTLFELPRTCSAGEASISEILRQGLPTAMSLALSDRPEAAARQVRDTFDMASEVELGDGLVSREAVFNQFHLLELQALVAGFDYEVEQKTFPARFLGLAESCGFMPIEHHRIYATHGDGPLDAGTHLFSFRKR